MNFVSTGVQEVTRRLRRQRNLHVLSFARRSADRADIELGKRGWEALRDDPSVGPHLEALGKLSDEVEAANVRVRALDVQLHEQEVQRETARKEHQQALAQIEEERKPLLKSIEELQSRLAESNKKLQEHAAQVRALEHESSELAKNAQRLPHDPKREEKAQTINERRTAITQRLAEMDSLRPALAQAKEETEQELTRLRASLLSLVQRGNQAKLSLGSRERAATVAIAGLVKQIAQLRRKVGRIEEKKDPSFLPIGRRLSVTRSRRAARARTRTSRNRTSRSSSARHRRRARSGRRFASRPAPRFPRRPGWCRN